MSGIDEIITKIISKRELNEEKKFSILRAKKIDNKIIDYLKNIMANIQVEGLENYECSLFELMMDGKLKEWSWQTTESAIVFFNDDDLIERGYIYLDKTKPICYHSWISFNFDGNDYVFDPCLNLLCEKFDYYKYFAVVLKGKVSAHDVKLALIKRLIFPTESFDEIKYSNYYDDNYTSIIPNNLDDISNPFYKNDSGYRIEFENGKVKKMIVHYNSKNN